MQPKFANKQRWNFIFDNFAISVFVLPPPLPTKRKLSLQETANALLHLTGQLARAFYFLTKMPDSKCSLYLFWGKIYILLREHYIIWILMNFNLVPYVLTSVVDIHKNYVGASRDFFHWQLCNQLIIRIGGVIKGSFSRKVFRGSWLIISGQFNFYSLK